MKTYIFPNTFSKEEYGEIIGFYEYLEDYLRQEKEYFHTDPAITPCRIILLVNGRKIEGELFVNSRNDYIKNPVENKYTYGYLVTAIWKYKHPISFSEFIELSGFTKVVKNYRAEMSEMQYFILQTIVDPIKLL